MTVTLGWKSLLLAVVVALLAVGAVGWSIHRANKDALELGQKSARLILENERLQQEAEKALTQAEEAETVAEEVHEELEEVEKDLRASEEALQVAERATRRARETAKAANRALAASEELPLVQGENTLLRAQNELLKKGLDLSKQETVQVRTALDLTKLALEKRTRQVEVWEERYNVLEKHTKRAQRRQILQGIGIGLGSAGIGFAGGYVAAKVQF